MDAEHKAPCRRARDKDTVVLFLFGESWHNTLSAAKVIISVDTNQAFTFSCVNRNMCIQLKGILASASKSYDSVTASRQLNQIPLVRS
jgi:hypothetical protein